MHVEPCAVNWFDTGMRNKHESDCVCWRRMVEMACLSVCWAQWGSRRGCVCVVCNTNELGTATNQRTYCVSWLIVVCRPRECLIWDGGEGVPVPHHDQVVLTDCWRTWSAFLIEREAVREYWCDFYLYDTVREFVIWYSNYRATSLSFCRDWRAEIERGRVAFYVSVIVVVDTHTRIIVGVTSAAIAGNWTSICLCRCCCYNVMGIECPPHTLIVCVLLAVVCVLAFHISACINNQWANVLLSALRTTYKEDFLHTTNTISIWAFTETNTISHIHETPFVLNSSIKVCVRVCSRILSESLFPSTPNKQTNKQTIHFICKPHQWTHKQKPDRFVWPASACLFCVRSQFRDFVYWNSYFFYVFVWVLIQI